MDAIPSIRVVFLLAFLFSQAAGAELGPLAVELALPPTLKNKAIWHVARLPQGKLAVGFEGGLAVGYPGGVWRIVNEPSGRAVQRVAANGSATLAAGIGFCALFDGERLRELPAMRAEYFAVEPVPEGWLVTGADGVWLVDPTGKTQNIVRYVKSEKSLHPQLCRIDGIPTVSVYDEPPCRWQAGKLVVAPELVSFRKNQLMMADGDIRISRKEIMDRNGTRVVTETNRELTVREGGVVGLADFGSVLLVATLNGGVAAYERLTAQRLWTWRAAGDIFAMVRDGDGVLVASATGVYSLANPERIRRWTMQNVVSFGLEVKDGNRVDFMTTNGVQRIHGNSVEHLPERWTSSENVSVAGAHLLNWEAKVELMNPHVWGLAVLGDTAAALLADRLILLRRDGTQQETRPAGVLSSLATDGRNFLVGTAGHGVYVVSREGRVIDRMGEGRASVRAIRPDKAVLLYWDGRVLDSDGNSQGRVPVGNPRDAALVHGRLAVLVTRPDREPLIGLLRGEEWCPLEVPGLAEIGAEYLVATETHLFVAGARGGLRIQLPVAEAAPPPMAWRWSAPLAGDEVAVADAATAAIQVEWNSGELAPAPATYLRARVGEGAWMEFSPGNPFPLAVAAGRTPVELQVERNGRVGGAQFVVVRPWPWWLRAWAWPLHACALGGLVLGLVRLRTRRLQRRTRELEARVAERTAELRKANAVKEEFLASISHEIRNPLNGVVGICEILSERKVGPREHMLVRTLGGCADQLRSMLDDILEFSQLERLTPTLSNTDFELVALVEECARVMDPDLTACSLLLPEQPVWLHGDSGKIRQVLCNLISNALKYGVPREAGVEVQVSAADRGRARLRIAVRNTGPTIPAEEITGLFESFRRGSRTSGVPGSGLGLAVCRRLSVAMGGHLTAASQEGVTEFAFEVLLPSAQPVVRPASAPTAVSRALAIEDEDYNRVVLGHVLRALGYSVDWAEDAGAALRLAAANPYDLILTDWRLPDMEGGELCRRLLAIIPAPQPPVIAVTAYANADKLAEARAAGMAGFVTKPLTREKLEKAIRGMSSGRQPRRSLDAETGAAAGPKSPLASLGALAPSPLQLATQLADRWRSVSALAALQDPRTGRETHSLRTLLLMAGETAAAEQAALLERAADTGDWATVRQVCPIVAEEIGASEARLRS